MITETERYVISFFGVDSKYYTNEFVAHLWEESSNKEYRNSGIFITARMSIERLVCGQIRGCTLGDTAHIITSVRNPVEVRSQEAFWNSYINITKEVREKLGIQAVRFPLKILITGILLKYDIFNGKEDTGNGACIRKRWIMLRLDRAP